MDPDKGTDPEDAIQLADVSTPLMDNDLEGKQKCPEDSVVTMNSPPKPTPAPISSRFSGQTSLTGRGLKNKVRRIFVRVVHKNFLFGLHFKSLILFLR